MQNTSTLNFSEQTSRTHVTVFMLIKLACVNIEVE